MPEVIDSIVIKVKLDDSLVNKQLNKLKNIASNINVRFNNNSINREFNRIQNKFNQLFINPNIGANIGKQIATNITASGSLIGNALGEVIGAVLTSKAVSSNIGSSLSDIGKQIQDSFNNVQELQERINTDKGLRESLKKGGTVNVGGQEYIVEEIKDVQKKIQYKLNNKPLILPIKTKIESAPKIPKIAQPKVGLGVLGGLKGLGGGLIGYAVISKGIREISAATKEAVESAEGLAKLDSVLKSTGNTTGFTNSQLNDMANNVSKVTNYTDENITSAQTLLATFSNIKGDIFSGAIKGATDLSSIFGVDLNTSTKQIAKLLNDPLANLNSLKKAGISFSDEQKKNIQTLINQNKLYEAQKIILDEINSKVGGAAQQSANSFTQVKNLMGEVRERIGQVVVDTITLGTGFSGIKGWLDKIITKFDEFRKTEAYISIIAKLRFSFQYLFIVAETGFKNILTLVRPIIEAIGALIDIVVSAIGVFGKIATALGVDSITNSFKELNSQLGNLPIISSTLKIPGELIQNHREAFNKLQKIREEYLTNLNSKPEPLIKGIATPDGIIKSEDKVTKTLDKAKNKAKELKDTINSAFNIGDIANWWDTFLQSTQDISSKLEEAMIGLPITNKGNRDYFSTGRGDKMFDNSFNNPNEKNINDTIEETSEEQLDATEESNELLGQIARNVGVFA